MIVTRLLTVLALLLASASCAHPLEFIGVRFVYKRAPLPESQILRDISYDPATGSPKQRLDLYMPTPGTRRWPAVVFIHGGSWTSGDRSLEVGGADVYGNIGRFLAQHGYGTAVISYRLIPDVDWITQAEDVAKAVKWVHDNGPGYGALGNAIVLMGHSSGAQLAARAALDPQLLPRVGVPALAIRGLIAVSGAGYDLTDQETYRLGNDPAFYAARFQRGVDDVDWRHAGSVLPLLRNAAKPPPALVIYADGETKALQRQSQLFVEALTRAGQKPTVIVAPGLSHTRIVPTLSRDDRAAGAAVLAFLRSVVEPSAGEPSAGEP